MYDIIGDIHGHAAALERLLGRLGYERRRGVYRHPDRRVVFLGDFIDRGPAIRETLDVVRRMIDAGAALAVMGNHELNALAFHTPDPHAPGNHLRPHNETNCRQHAETMRQLPPGELESALDFFRTLPLWLDLDGLRAVHACWDESRMAKVAAAITGPGETAGATGVIDEEFLVAACSPRGGLFEPVEAILKGKEAKLPPGTTFRDKDGHERKATRVKWYESPHGHTYRTYAMASEPIDSEVPLPDAVVAAAVPYPADGKPVFVGHYWLSGPRPALLRGNVACLDWSVAKGGFLCGYSWDGERELDEGKFQWTT